MFLFYLSCVLLSLRPLPAAAATVDSIGIYRTQQDYLCHRIIWLSDQQARLNIQPQFSGFPLNVDSDDILYLRQTGGHKQRIRPDSVFGFIRQGVQYLYFSREKRYMAVLNDKPPLVLVLKTDVHIYAELTTVDDTLMYTRSVGEPLKVFAKENIIKDFGDNGELATRLLLLSKAITREQYDADVHSKDFRGYLQMVRDYLYGDLPIQRRHYSHSLM